MTKRTTKPTIPKERRNWKPSFLAALARSLNVTKAARTARVNRQRVYEVRATDEEFAKQWDAAIAQAIDTAEGELYRRAVTGLRKPITVAGKKVIVTEYSDSLLQFLLKAHRAERYRETIKQQITGANDGPIEIGVKAVDYRTGLAALAAGPTPDRDAPSQTQDPGDGPAVG